MALLGKSLLEFLFDATLSVPARNNFARAVRRTHIDSLYGRRNTDPVTVPSQWGDQESTAVIVRQTYGQAQIGQYLVTISL